MNTTRSGPLHPVAAVALAGLGVALMVWLARSLAPALGHAGLDASDVIRAQIALGSVALLLPTLLTLLALRRASWHTTIALGLLRPRAQGLAVLLGAALWVGSLGLLQLQAAIWPPSPAYLQAFRAIHHALAPTSPLDALVSVAVIALLPALAEELVVRGVLLPSLVRPLGPVAAVVASSILFALMHDPYRYLFTMAVGLALGTLRLRSGSLWPSIIAHASLNTLTFLVAPFVDDPSQTSAEPQPLLGLALLAAGAAVAIPLLRALGAALTDKGAPPRLGA